MTKAEKQTKRRKGQSGSKAMLYDSTTALRDALINMLGAFDNAARRLKFPSDFGDEAIESAHAALESAGCRRRPIV